MFINSKCLGCGHVCICSKLKLGTKISFSFLDIFDLFAVEFVCFWKPWHWFLSDSWNYHLTALYDNTLMSEHVWLTLSDVEEFCWSWVTWLCTLRIQMYIHSWVLLTTAVFLQPECVCRLLCLSLSFMMAKSGYFVCFEGWLLNLWLWLHDLYFSQFWLLNLWLWSQDLYFHSPKPGMSSYQSPT